MKKLPHLFRLEKNETQSARVIFSPSLYGLKKIKKKIMKSIQLSKFGSFQLQNRKT